MTRTQINEKKRSSQDAFGLLKLCGIAIALIILCYLCLLATANSSPKLLVAIAFEVGFILCILGFRYLSGKRRSQKAKKAVIEVFLSELTFIDRIKKILVFAALCIVLPLVAFLLIDLSALVGAIAGAPGYAKTAYKMIPTYMVYEGAHPAISLELYSGACIEAGKFERAHQYTDQLLAIREDIYGKHHSMYGGMVANLANLYYKEGKFKEAEDAYRESLRICVAHKGYEKLGSALTKLGNCLREQGRFLEAKQSYEEALSMREKEFGPDSRRVGETCRELALLMTYLHKDKRSDQLFERVNKIIKQHSKETNSDTISLVLFALASVAVSFLFFGKRGLLTRIAQERLERRVLQNPISPDPDDVEKLRLILEFREEKEKLETLKTKGIFLSLAGALAIESY
ncbi:tetratricopeptide repeat protein [bacterium]|nr:tetratricopeptide repeat protein [bacterium]